VSDVDQRLMALALAGPLIWLTVADAKALIIPDGATALIAVVGFTRLAMGDPDIFVPVELGAALVTLGVFWLIGEIYWRGHGQEALGVGDAKLLAAGCLCVGIAQVWLVLLLACVGGIIAATLSRRTEPSPRRGIAFGPFLAFAIFLVSQIGAF
jgi:leader peptidase (prepilin peptidase) / N-methyltransferase